MTRNQDTYSHGWMWLYHNKAYNNGINGLVVHKTDRVHVVGNVIWDNGKVPKTAPEHRQSYAGLTVNQAKTVKVSDNIVKTDLKNDYAYVLVSGSTLTSGSENNKVKISVSPRSVSKNLYSFLRIAKFPMNLVQAMERLCRDLLILSLQPRGQNVWTHSHLE